MSSAGEPGKLRLWTLQGKCHSLTQGRVDPRRSEYLNSAHISGTTSIRPAYELVWERLNTDQIIWCHVEDPRLGGAQGDGVMWELRVPRAMEPEGPVLAVVRPTTWESLIRVGPLAYREPAIYPETDVDAWVKEVEELAATQPPGPDFRAGAKAIVEEAMRRFDGQQEDELLSSLFTDLDGLKDRKLWYHENRWESVRKSHDISQHVFATPGTDATVLLRHPLPKDYVISPKD